MNADSSMTIQPGSGPTLGSSARALVVKAAVGVATVATATVLMAATAWAQTSAPNPAPQAPPGLDGAANTFLGWMKWGGLIAGILGLFISGVMMMVGRRNRSTTAVDGATGIPWVLGGLTTVSFASAIVGAVLT